MPEQKGHFKVEGATRTWSGGSSTKFYIDIEKGDKYAKIGEFEFFGDKIDLSKFKEGDEVNVSFNINGSKRKWEDKKTGEKKEGFFQSLVAWRMDVVDGGNNHQENSPDSSTQEEDKDPLPF